jgi:hypothetical protein
MREKGTWRKELARDLLALQDMYGPLPLFTTELLDIELILTIMQQSFVGEDPYLAWTILNGQPYPALNQLSEQQRKALVIARLHLQQPVGRHTWEEWLKIYTTLPSPYPLYCIDKNLIYNRDNAILPERRDIIKQALAIPPEWAIRKKHYAPAGRYRFSIKREWHEVELPQRIEPISLRPVSQLKERSPELQPLSISLEALVIEADWMDRVAPKDSDAANQSWGARMRGIQFHLIDATGLCPTTQITLDGLMHLIGMVGSGKSSLFTVLTVYLARRGYRVVMVLSDVAAVFKEQKIFHAFSSIEPDAFQAVPFVGKTTRISHLNRLYRAEAARIGISFDQNHPSYSFLSTVCPLDGLRQDIRPIPPGEEPCTRLYTLEDEEKEEKEDEKYDCPFMPVCPVHHRTHTLAEARIWLATPASLLASGPQGPLLPLTMQYVDIVMRHAHVMLIDEGDLVQVQFDNRFAPMEVLVRERGESWLDRVATQVSRQVYRSGRPLVGKYPGLDRWLVAHDNTQRAVNRLYIHLRDKDSAARRWLGTTYFSHDRLIARLAWELRDVVPSNDDFVRQAQNFKFSPLVIQKNPRPKKRQVGEVETPLAWYRAVHLEMLESDTSQALLELKNWLQEQNIHNPPLEEALKDNLALHLLIMLLVVILDHAMQLMILQWPATEGLDLDRGTGGLFFHPTEDQLCMVPEPAMGSVIGFQYYDNQQNGNGELRFFYVRGTGRSLLYHLHDALNLSDDIAGPHIVLTSGTSWAPGSWKYHLHRFPDAVLLPMKENTADAPQRTRIQCFYDPLPNPHTPGKYLRISGIEDTDLRLKNLQAMVDMLTRAQAFRPSMLDNELNILQPHRKRILLVVGSYIEAEFVGNALASILAEQHPEFTGDEVLTLIPDSEGDSEGNQQISSSGKLRRSLLNQMPQLSARFLVAPLQAIERGHNILVGQEAAIGSVYFLVRPYPVPGDIHVAINQLNFWSIEYVPKLTHLSATDAGKFLRQEASRKWEEALEQGKRYKELDDDERTPLLWTQFVLVWQCIGRLLRGGATARVHFVDARWAENSPMGQGDTEKTSMLLGFRRILRQAINTPDPAERAIATTLYGEAAQAFENIQGVYNV